MSFEGWTSLKHKNENPSLGKAWGMEHLEGGSVSFGSSFLSIGLQRGLLGSLVSGRLFSHVGDPFLDDPLPREYVLYLRPTGPLAQKLSDFWQQSKQICGKNKAHNIFPHITLCQFFMVSHGPSPAPAQGSLAAIRQPGPCDLESQCRASQAAGRKSHRLLGLDGPSRNE